MTSQVVQLGLENSLGRLKAIVEQMTTTAAANDDDDDDAVIAAPTAGTTARITIPRSRWLHEVAAFRKSIRSLTGGILTDADMRKSHPIYNFM